MASEYKAGGAYPSAADRNCVAKCPGCHDRHMLTFFCGYRFPGETIAHLTCFCDSCGLLVEAEATPPALVKGRVIEMKAVKEARKNPQG